MFTEEKDIPPDMKKFSYVIILFILLIVAAYFFFSDRTSTISKEFTDFAIEDTSSVNKIFISDPAGRNALLTRQSDNSWKINEKYKARIDGVELLLAMFKMIKVKEIVPESGIDNVITKMAGGSIKVEIFTGGTKPEKVYYVGNATQNHFGTYMLLELKGKKSIKPYIMHIPGFHGYLTARFFTEENLWRDRSIFKYDGEEIDKLSIRYNEKPLKSFEIEKQGKSYNVTDLATKEEIKPVMQDVISEYLDRFKPIHFEFIPENTAFVNIDSVKKTLPIHEIEVQYHNGEKITLKTYYKPVKESMMIIPETGENYTHDLDRFYALINNTDFVVMQWPLLDNILAYNDDFRLKEIVDN